MNMNYIIVVLLIIILVLVVVSIFLTNKYFIPLFTERNDILYLCYPMLDDYFNFQKKIKDIVIL